MATPLPFSRIRLAALANSCLLFLAVGGIMIEAVQRFARPQPVETSMVIWVAAAGIVINMATAMLFWKGQKDDINLRGAFIHMVADAAVSLGVSREDLEKFFGTVTAAGRITNDWTVEEEQDLTVYVAEEPREALQALWPKLAGRN